MKCDGSRKPRVIDRLEIEQMIRENERDRKKSLRMTAKSKAGYMFSGMNGLDELVHERLERGQQLDHVRVNYPHGTVIRQGQRGWFYRGEREVYAKSIPSLLRKLESYPDVRSRELYRLVADMRVAEFAMLIDHFEAVRDWDQCDVLYELLAQHYGLETPWLDITNDFGTALFFATCVFEHGRWRPLTQREIDRDDNSRYGVMFRAQHGRVLLDMVKAHLEAKPGEERPLFSEGFSNNVPLPIGYQPFLRCTAQMGYGIYMRTPAPLQEDCLFEELRFKHDVKLCESVFEAYDGGKAIYPDEGIELVQHHIDQIARATCFSEEAFGYALKRNHLYRIADRDKCLEDLESFTVDGKRIEISGHPISIGRSRVLQVDMRYNKSGAERPGRDYEVYYWQHMPSLPVYAPWMLPESREFEGVLDTVPEQPKFRDASSFYDDWYPMTMHLLRYAEIPNFWEKPGDLGV